MSITVNFYTFSKRDNSTAQPSGSGTSLSCNLRYSCSILTPQLELTTPISNPKNLNYAYISDFGRYYWVTDWSFETGFWIANLKVDVLASYRTQIGTSSLYVLRSASAYTPAIMDGKYPMRSDILMNSALADPDFIDTVNNKSFNDIGCYVVGIAGGLNAPHDPNGGAITYYALTELEMKWLIKYLFDGSLNDASDISVQLQKQIFNPFQYIVSCNWFPMSLPDYTQTDLVKMPIGYWEGDNDAVGCYIPSSLQILTYTAQISVPRHPQADRGYYLNGRPFTEVELHCYSFGSIPLDASAFETSPTLNMQIDVDVFAGTGFLTLTDYNHKIIHKQAGQISVPVQLSQITQDLINTAVSASGAIVSASIGNFVGELHGIISAVSGLFPQVTTSGEVGSRSCYKLHPMVTTKHHYIAQESQALLGRPLCEVRTINTLSGYIVVENGDIDSSATLRESAEIKSYLEGGFFYE